METAMDAINHANCDQYFRPLYQAVEIIMQRVYGDADIHREAFVRKGLVAEWNEHLRDVAEERWIDTIFGISALLSVTTQLNHYHSQSKLCSQHGLPFLRLAQAAASNIAIFMIEDALLHLSSLRRVVKNSQFIDNPKSSFGTSEKLLDSYWEVVNQASELVEDNSTEHQVEMVFSQFRFRELISKQWKERIAA
jgi:hypothetical protein